LWAHLAIVGAVAIGLYVVSRAGAVCPVQNEAFYDHFGTVNLSGGVSRMQAMAVCIGNL